MCYAKAESNACAVCPSVRRTISDTLFSHSPTAKWGVPCRLQARYRNTVKTVGFYSKLKVIPVIRGAAITLLAALVGLCLFDARLAYAQLPGDKILAYDFVEITRSNTLGVHHDMKIKVHYTYDRQHGKVFARAFLTAPDKNLRTASEYWAAPHERPQGNLMQGVQNVLIRVMLNDHVPSARTTQIVVLLFVADKTVARRTFPFPYEWKHPMSRHETAARGPDLVITNVDLEGSGTWFLIVTVENRGQIEATTVEAKCSYTCGGYVPELPIIMRNYLAPGNSMKGRSDGKVSCSGASTLHFTCWVDPRRMVEETDEENNVYQGAAAIKTQ